MKTNKKGISLIVLVITIIVMIILATAIILSLNSSNMSSKASEAKLSSDLANKKEAASVYVAEYELKVAKGKIDKATTTVDAYVKAEMKKAGIDTSDVAVQEDGTILVGIAALFVNNNVEIGTEVEGYILNNTTTYKTSGKENTCKSQTEESDPQPADISREEDIKWSYFGVNQNGDVLIISEDITSNSSEMTLGGKGAYLHGPQELNNACEAMYSGKMGIARSINMDDVIDVLEYTGEKGGYTNTSGELILTVKAKTIDEIAEETGFIMSNFAYTSTPEEGKEIGTYKSDVINIDKEDDASKFNSSNSKVKDIIFLSQAGDDYWISSNCSTATFMDGGAAIFGVRFFTSSGKVTSFGLYDSMGYLHKKTSYLRPVVQLNPSVQMTYDGTKVTLK